MEKNLEAFEKIKNGNLKEHLKWDEYIACCDLVQGDLEILNLVKAYPDELGFVLQEKDYAAYVDTFGASDEVVLTEEQFYKLKQYFTKKEK